MSIETIQFIDQLVFALMGLSVAGVMALAALGGSR